MVDSLMSTRASQLELRHSPEVFSDGFESSLSPLEIADRRCSHNEHSNALHQARSQSRIPFCLIGLLLTATAIAKLWMLLTDSFADLRVGLPKEILWLSVAFEFWLAFENFRVREQRVLALVNTAVFGCFAVFASVRWLIGYRACGCTGNLELPIWLFILIDVSIAVWLSSTPSKRSRLRQGVEVSASWWLQSSTEKRGRIAGLALLAGFIGAMQLPVAAPMRALIIGESPIMATTTIDGNLYLNQKISGTVEIWNRYSKPAKIVGIARSCRCFELTDDPIARTIPGNGHLRLQLFIKPNKPGPLHQRVVLFLDHHKQLRVNVDVVGFVKGVEG
jgi:hypothetical protein